MSPERFTGNRAGPQVDAYAWGAIMVFAATDNPPFRVTEPEGVFAHLNREPRLDVVPEPLSALAARPRAKDPAQRSSPRATAHGAHRGRRPPRGAAWRPTGLSCSAVVDRPPLTGRASAPPPS